MFQTKGYTLSYFLKLFNSTSNRAISSNGVYGVVSPLLGSTSVRATVLNTWLGNKTTQITNGTGKFASYGTTPRARILKALRNRKTTGSI
jgi:hypothetical protein